MTKQESTVESIFGWVGKRASLIGTAVSVVAVSSVLFQFCAPIGFLVSSSPPGATVELDGEDQGATPLALKLRRGVHQVKLRLNGYEEEHRVFRLQESDSLFVSLRAVPQSVQPPQQNADTLPVGNVEQQLVALASELAKLKSAIVDDPSEVASLEVIRGRLKLFETQIASTEASIERITDTVKWFYATIAAIVVGLLGVTMTLFVAKK